jgi:hypothetical protein
MSATLYLLRQQPNRLSPSLFRAGDADTDIVFLEHDTSIVTSSLKGVVQRSEGMVVSESSQTLTYDELIEKIFSFEHVIVI